MSHYANILDGLVTQVIVADQDFINSGIMGDPTTWIQTSYNTRGNVHYDPVTNLPDGGTPLRGNYAGPGYIYDKTHDVFYTQSPHPNWILNTTTWTWDPPIPCPSDGNSYVWSDSSSSWVRINT
jgi:hypothetical protein